MKKNHIFTVLFVIFTSFAGFGQTFVTQDITHSTDATPDNTDGCSSVKLIVYYTIGGTPYGASSSTVVLDENNSTTLSTQIPNVKGLVVTQKQIHFISPNGAHFYTITGGSNTENVDNIDCFCDNDVRSRILDIYETSSEITYSFTHPMSLDCQ